MNPISEENVITPQWTNSTGTRVVSVSEAPIEDKKGIGIGRLRMREGQLGKVIEEEEEASLCIDSTRLGRIVSMYRGDKPTQLHPADGTGV